MLNIDGNFIYIDTPVMTATFDRGILTSLVRKSDARSLVHASAEFRASLTLVYIGQEVVPIGADAGDRISILPVNDHCAQVRVEAWNGDGVITISEDPISGGITVEPSGYASRIGLRSCRWTVPGIDASLSLIAPLWQGVRLPLNDTLLHDYHCPWPFRWEAGLAILEDAAGSGFWIHCEDSRYRYKAMHIGSQDEVDWLSFDTESYGPLEHSLGSGALAWHINVFEGGWRIPATRYRDWLAHTYHPEQTPRPHWLQDIRFAVSWCPCDTAILDALSRRLDPAHVLLHIPSWRRDGYDQNYPTFTASEAGRVFIAKAQTMGFRAMPHFNSIDMDPTHPVYPFVRDFQYREVESHRLQGWTWVEGRVKPLQESNTARLRHQDKNTMVKIHPGLSMWRSILTEHVREAVEAHSLKLAFLDVTLCTWNLHNCLAENMTPTEGMRNLIAQVASIGQGLYVGGEGRNEITMRDTSVSQVHLFESPSRSIDGLQRTGGCPVNEFLFGQWSRSFGYSGLGGQTEDEAMRMRLQVSLGAMPTIIIQTADEIEHPKPAVEEMLQMAEG